MSAPFNDEPTLTDQLDRAGWVKSLTNDIRNCEPPYVFSIHGDWGSGKTSFLQQVHFALTGRPVVNNPRIKLPLDPLTEQRKLWAPLVTVWFEAWRFQHDPAPIVALLQQMRRQLAAEIKLLCEVTKLTEVTIRSLLGTLDKLSACIFGEVVGGIVPSADSIQKIGEQWEANHFQTVSFTVAIRNQLEQLIQELIGKEGRVVILIDDLDRCQPGAAFKLLEGIKIYLNLPNCIFVLAMDHRNLERAIAQCLPSSKPGSVPGTFDTPSQAREYLEKICQDVWQLPLVPPAKLKAFLNNSLQDHLPGFEDVAARVLALLETHACLPANARKLKAYANTLRRFIKLCANKDLVDGQSTEFQARLLVIMSCLYHFHPMLYRRLENNPAFINEITSWSEGTAQNDPVFAGIQVLSDQNKGHVIASADPVIGDVLRITALLRASPTLTKDNIKQYLLPHALSG